jgi:hypothetical protein
MNLFLDDIRVPLDAWNYTKQTMFLKEEWEIVRNYLDFTECIEKHGLPTLISFDHDLADNHYDISIDYTKYYDSERDFEEYTGYDCAKWLINYCMDNNKPLPKFYVHSMNPVGKENIEQLLNNFIKWQKISV